MRRHARSCLARDSHGFGSPPRVSRCRIPATGVPLPCLLPRRAHGCGCGCSGTPARCLAQRSPRPPGSGDRDAAARSAVLFSNGTSRSLGGLSGTSRGAVPLFAVPRPWRAVSRGRRAQGAPSPRAARCFGSERAVSHLAARPRPLGARDQLELPTLGKGPPVRSPAARGSRVQLRHSLFASHGLSTGFLAPRSRSRRLWRGRVGGEGPGRPRASRRDLRTRPGRVVPFNERWGLGRPAIGHRGPACGPRVPRGLPPRARAVAPRHPLPHPP